MAWETHAAKAMFPRFAKDWDRLNAQLCDGHPLYASSLVGPLLDAYADERTQLCIHRTNGVISGALILRTEGMGHWTSFRPSRAQSTPVLLSDAGLMEALLPSLPGFALTIDLQAIDPRHLPDCSRLMLPMIINGHARRSEIHMENGFPDFTNRHAENLLEKDDRQPACAKKESGPTVLSNSEHLDAAHCSTVQSIRLFRNAPLASAWSVLKAIRRSLRGSTNRSITSEQDTPPRNVIACTCIEEFGADQYNLQRFAARTNIEVSIDWFDLLQENVFPDDPGVRYYFEARNNLPSAILPLRLTTKRGVRTIESLGNYYTSLYTPLLTEDSDILTLRHLLSSATQDHGGAHVMRFAPMDPESPAYRGLLNELWAIGWIPFRFFCFGNWFLKVDDDWQGYLKKRSVKLRSTIKRMNKKFSAEGGSLEIVTTGEQLEQAIAAFQEVYSASWKVPEPYPDFVPSLIRRLTTLGMLRLGIARLHEKPIAAQLWIVGQDRASIYKVAYDEAFASFSPGTVLTSYLMQYVIEQDRVKEVDFLTGDDKYKQIWMSDRRERWGIVAYNPSTIIGFALFVRESVGRIAKSVLKRIKAACLEAKRHCSRSKKQPITCTE